MAKTFEALKRAEDERKIQIDEFPVPSKIETLHMPERLVMENHRLKYNLLQLTPGKNIKAISFSSCNTGEGNSTVLLNFAKTLAADGERVLLVDANLRAPSLHSGFKVGPEKGLSDLLLGRSPLAGLIRETAFPNLMFIPSGSPLSNPVILLQSDSLGPHVKAMKEKAEWVLLDSPPIVRFMDPILLAQRVDGVVMVVEAKKTRWEVARSSIERVMAGNGRVLGIVLNKRHYPIPHWLYRRL